MPGIFSHAHNLLFSLLQSLGKGGGLSVSSHYPNLSPSITPHRYLPLITPPLPSLSLFAPPLSFSCHRLPLLSSAALVLLLVSLACCILFSTRWVNKMAWFHQCESVSPTRRDPDESIFSYAAIHHDRIYAFTHGDARQLVYKRNVSSSFTVPTFPPSLEDSGVSGNSNCWL